MAKLPIPFRRKKTPAEHAFDALRSAFKFWAGTKAAKAVAGAAPKRSPLVGLGVLAGGVVAFKKLRGGTTSSSSAPLSSAPSPNPPKPPASTSPKVDPNRREPPHGDVASDLLKGDDRAAASGGRTFGTSGTAPSAEPPGTTGTGGEGTSAAAPPAGTGGTSSGSPSDMPGGPVGDDDAPRTIAPGTPAGEDPGGDVPPITGSAPQEGTDDLEPPPSGGPPPPKA